MTFSKKTTIHKYQVIYFLITCTVLSTRLFATQPDETKNNHHQTVFDMIKNMLDDNEKFIVHRGESYFKPFMNKEKPRATIVGCTDSRFHNHAFDITPDNDIYLVRNFGNQLATSEGSVEYSVKTLGTALLIFIGHSDCTAIHCATEGFDSMSQSIKRELENIEIPFRKKNPSEVELAANVDANIHAQVRGAMNKFRDLVDSGKLVVAGALYDLKNEKSKGYGRLIFINLNGDKDEKSINTFLDEAKLNGKHESGSKINIFEKALLFFRSLIAQG
jgi:carbonic anhydrase